MLETKRTGQNRLRKSRTLQDPIIDIRVIPHERGFEVIVVPVPVNSLQRINSQKYARQRVQQVVIDVELCQIPVNNY